ncbi:SseB family protein [Actinomadura sp. 9N407]|uniref:SseB family protein n=1 Tax=Actinomadura sp. 9N407 TaxID=3375154 RepID=UPI00378E7024
MDWKDFAGRLTIELMRLPVRSYLIVQDPSGLPYVQAMRTDEEIDAEAVGNAFLPRPLAPGQERRLTVNGWERPDDRDRQNWWYLVSTVDRSGRPAPDMAELCAALASRMVAAFRDVYGVRSPLGLVYQASSTDDELAGPMDLPGLGIPRAIVEDEAADPDGAPPATAPPNDPRGRASGARLETALAAARERGDQDGYLALIARALLYLPSPTDPTYEDASGHQYATAVFGDETFVLAFTSPTAMDRSLRGQAVHHREAFISELVQHWPNPEWQLAINPGLPSASYLDAAALFATAGHRPPVAQPVPQENGRAAVPGPEASNGRSAAPRTQKDVPVVQKAPAPPPPAPPKPKAAPPPPPKPPAAPRPEPNPEPPAPAQAAPQPQVVPEPQVPIRTAEPTPPAPPAPAVPVVPPPVPPPVPPKPVERPEAQSKPRPQPNVTVMQKVVRPEHVAHYLSGGYDLVAGYVHRLRDVRELNTPATLVRGLGLVFQGTPFLPGDEAMYVIRWPAVKPALFRKPLGGIDEWSMSIIPGGWVIEKAPFPGSGYAPGEGTAIPEFKIASQRLPHGAEMYRIERSGREKLVAGYDADRRQWLLRPGMQVPAPPPVATSAPPPAGEASGDARQEGRT